MKILAQQIYDADTLRLKNSKSTSELTFGTSKQIAQIFNWLQFTLQGRPCLKFIYAVVLVKMGGDE